MGVVVLLSKEVGFVGVFADVTIVRVWRKRKRKRRNLWTKGLRLFVRDIDGGGLFTVTIGRIR